MNGPDGSPTPVEFDDPQLVVVGIGASAGGVEALEHLFSVMPDSMGMAYVVVQHLSADFESLMHQIIGRRTKMTVEAITEGVKVKANRVYVLPGGKDVTIRKGRLRLEERNSARGFHHPINHFFSSLAEDVGPNSIGIVLSGTGSDGSNGILKIHDAGGLVVVQSEQSAKFHGMPRSAINTGIADSIATVGEIPNVLIRFSELFRSEAPGSRSDLFANEMEEEKRILHLLHSSFGIDFDEYKTAMFGRRIERRILLTHATSLAAYLKRLESDPAELNSLYSDLLIGVTEFFRDPEAFRELKKVVLPELIENADANGIRIWIAPCATGEEAYSIAMLVDEYLRESGRSITVKIFATDVNQDCIDFASQGVYREEFLVNVSKKRRDMYFREDTHGFRVSRHLRKMVVFAKHNVLVDAPFTKIDLVCCRNLLIYFKPEAKQKALSLFNFALKPERFLFLGPSETPSQLENEFEVVSGVWRFYRKVASVRLGSVRIVKPPAKNEASGGTVSDVAQLKRSAALMPIYDGLLTKFMPSSLLIDQHHEVLHIFGDANQFLGLQSGRPTTQLFQLLPSNFLTAVKNGLKRIKIESKPVVFSGIKLNDQPESPTFRISVELVESNQKSPSYLIAFEESVRSKESTSSYDSMDNDQVLQLKDELESTRESLHATILDLKSANEDMQSTNEELIAANEELQSTNEELHSVNEELYTVNSEHQRKITELTEMTDDMDNLLDSIQVDTIFLDRELRVRKFTLGIANTFRLLPQDIGRHFDTFNHELNHSNVVGLAKQVLETAQPHEEEVPDMTQNWYLMRILPYNSRGKIDGVLITLVDITTIKETESRLAELSEIVQVSDDAIFRIAHNGDIRTWNQGARKLFMCDSEDIIGKNISTLSLDDEGRSTIADALRRISQGEKIKHFELKAVRRNGVAIDAHLSLAPIYEVDGTLGGGSVVLRDISAQKQTQIQVQQEVKRRDQFLAMLSHELRNPIAAIVSSLAVLESTDPTSSKKEVAIGVISRHSRQLSKLLDDLLDVSRITHDKINLDLQPVNLVSLSKQVIECIEGIVKKKGLSLTIETPDQPVIVMCDETRIVQAQVNLLVNAAKYTPDNGQIKYSVYAEDDNAIIEIEDDGEGMTADLLNKIFDVFVQADQPLDRSQGGMGLGLPLVRMIAEAHGGTINATSNGPGNGSLFRLEMPLTRLALIPNHESNKKDLSILNGLSLLLVEDIDGTREMLADYLGSKGFDITTASNGVEAVKSFAKHRQKICVVDIGLPDLNGFEVAKQIRATEPTASLLIALTGYGQQKDKENAVAAGFDLHLVKPLDPAALVGIIFDNCRKLDLAATTSK